MSHHNKDFFILFSSLMTSWNRFVPGERTSLSKKNSQFKIDRALIKCVLAGKVSSSSLKVFCECVCVRLRRWDNQEEAASFSEVVKKKKKEEVYTDFQKVLRKPTDCVDKLIKRGLIMRSPNPSKPVRSTRALSKFSDTRNLPASLRATSSQTRLWAAGGTPACGGITMKGVPQEEGECQRADSVRGVNIT